MRLMIVTAAIAALSFPAFAQQGRPQQAPRPAQQQPAQQQDAPAPGMFACRTATEICYIGIVTGPNQVSVLYTNDPNADGIDAGPVKVQGADVSKHAGRVVMLTGRFSAQAGLSGAQVIDVAGPLLSFAIKSMLAGGGEEEAEEPPPPEPAPPQRQRQPQRR